MAFLIAAGLLLLLVVSILAWAVTRAPRSARREDLHEQLEAELASDVAAGVLPAEDYAAAVGDLDTAGENRGQRARLRPRRASAPWAWILVAVVAVAGVVLYWQTGNWRAAIHGDRAAVMHRADDMLAQLQARLQAHPDDKQGWITLGRAKEAMGDYATAAAAYGRAVKLDHEKSPDLLARWGEAQVLADPDHLTAREHAIFAAVLKSDPDNIRGLWYGGLLALHAGNRDVAVSRWRRLLGEKSVPAPMAAFVRSRLNALGVPATAARPIGAADAPRIVLTVGVTPALAARIKRGQTLFVYVRDPAGGPPLAVKRVQIVKFPLQFSLGDDDSMLKDHDLTSMIGKTVEIGAFVSADGNATPQPGAPAARKRLVLDPGTQSLDLTLGNSSEKG